MKICETIDSLRTELATAGRIVFVPTMGNLHDGHISLMTQARQHGDCVVASIFVNRLQFRPGEDFDKYPRTFAADCARLKGAGVDVLFFPSEEEIYPQPQGYQVVPPAQHDAILEGEFRPGHFTGVATVVLKLFNIVGPQTALFGSKDYQQLMVIRNMVTELNLPIRIVAGATVRAEDGLALSSRNGYLNASERAEAPRLYQVLTALCAQLRTGAQNHAELEAAACAELSSHGWRPDYIAIRRRQDLQAPTSPSDALVILAAVHLGNTRLIDNLEV